MKTRPYNSLGPILVLIMLFINSNLWGFQSNGKLLNFQGSLYENGEAVNGERNFEFSIALDQGTWSETHSNVLVVDGLYAVVLGEKSDLPEDLFYTANERLITIKVGNNVLGTTSIYAPFGLFDQNKYLLKSDTSKFLSVADTILFVRQTEANQFMSQADSALFIRETEKDQFMSQADSALFIRETEKDQFMSQADSALFIRETEKDQFMSQADSSLFLRVEEKFNGGELSFDGSKNLNLINDNTKIGGIEVFGVNGENLGSLKGGIDGNGNEISYLVLSKDDGGGNRLTDTLFYDDLVDLISGEFILEAVNEGDSVVINTEIYGSGGASTNFGFQSVAKTDSSNIGALNEAYASATNKKAQYGAWGYAKSDYAADDAGFVSGVIGQGRSNRGAVYGVRGEARGANSTFSAAMRGLNFVESGANGLRYGGYFNTYASAGDSTFTGQSIGLRGNGGGSTNNYGVIGEGFGAGDENIGIYGLASGATTNWAGWFDGNVNIKNGQLDIKDDDGQGVELGQFALQYRGDDTEANVILGSNWVEGNDNRGALFLFADTVERSNRNGADIRRVDLVVENDGYGGSVGALRLKSYKQQDLVELRSEALNADEHYGVLRLRNTLTSAELSTGFAEDQNGDLGSVMNINGSKSSNFSFSNFWSNNNLPSFTMSGIDSLDGGGGNYYIPSLVNLSIQQNNGKDFSYMKMDNSLNNASLEFSFNSKNNNVLVPTMVMNGPSSTNFSFDTQWNNGDLPELNIYGIDSVDLGGGNYYIPPMIRQSIYQHASGKDYANAEWKTTGSDARISFDFNNYTTNGLMPSLNLFGTKSRIDFAFDDAQTGDDRTLVNFGGPNSNNFGFYGDYTNPDLPRMEMAGLDSIDSGGGNYYIPATVNLSILTDTNGNDYSLLDLNSTHASYEEVNGNIRMGSYFNNANLPFISMSGQIKDNGNLPELVFLGTGQTSGVDHVNFNIGTTTKTNITLTSNYDNNLPGMYWHGNQSSERLMDIGGSQDVGNSIDNIFFRLGATNQDSYSSPLFEAKTESDANGQWSTLLMSGNSSMNVEIGAQPGDTNGDDYGKINILGSKNHALVSATTYAAGGTDMGEVRVSDTLNNYSYQRHNEMYLELNGKFNTTIQPDRFQIYNLTNNEVVAAIDSLGNAFFNGSVFTDINAGASDRRLKKNINSLTGSLNKVEQLRGVSYNWKDENKPENRVGFIAQEVEKIVPEVVFTRPDGMKAIGYGDLTALLAEAVKELSAKVNALEKENQSLKLKAEETSELKSQVLSLEERLAQIEALINQKSTGNN